MPARGARTLLGALAATCAAGSADAAWEAVPEVGLTTEVDNNARIVPQEQETSTRTALDARLRIRGFGERGEIYVEPRFVTDAYADERDEELASDDWFMSIRASRDARRASFGLRTDYRSENILRSEFDDPLAEDPSLGSDPVQTGSGTFGTFTEQRELFDVGFNSDFELSERTGIGVDLTGIDVTYPDSETTNRSDFTSSTLSATLTRLVSATSNIGVSVYGTSFDAERDDNQSDTIGFEVGYSRPLGPTATFGIDVGVTSTESSLLDAAGNRVTSTETGFTYGVEVEKRGETTTWRFGMSQAMRPSSRGFLAQRDDLRVSVVRQVGPRLAISAGIRGVRVDEPAGVGETSASDNYVRGTVAFEWTLTERWQLSAGYDGVTQEYNDPTEAASDSVFVTVRYRGVSRR